MEFSERSAGMTRKPFANHARISEGVWGVKSLALFKRRPLRREIFISPKWEKNGAGLEQCERA